MLDFETHGHVAVLRLNRPEARNAINGAVATAMEEGLDRLESDDELWLGIIAGAGPVFSAGADLKEIAAGNGGALGTKRGGFGGITSRERTKPLIAAVDGPALAGGTEIALSCDMIVASREARFGIPEVKRSLVAAAGGLFRLPRTLPPNIAMEAALTGDPISAERAHHFGLVNELCEPGRAEATALALAARIEANAPLAVRESRRVMLASALADDETGFRLSNEAMGRLMKTNDFSEGPLAFIEKRSPNWSGT